MNKQLFKSILLLAGCFSFFLNTHAQNWEVKLLDNINPTNPTSSVWKASSSSVYPIALASPISILATGYIKKDKVLQKKGWQAAGALAINTVITQGLKYSINRARPYEKYPTLIHPYHIETDASFPSGHTSTAFATAASLSINFKKWYVVVPAYTWAASVGYSRLYLGEHYPTDVLAGAAIGVGSAYLSNWLNKKIFRKK
jgi:membrane-associated phospholipid phosphatase